MAKNKTINVKGTEITVFQGEQSDYISLTGIAKHKDAANTDDIIKNWLRIEIRLNCWVFGKRFTTRILNPSNSTGLESKLA